MRVQVCGIEHLKYFALGTKEIDKMTVKELKEFLKTIPDDYEVKVADAYLQEENEIDETCIYVHKEQKEIIF
jgi:uncharacterized protein YeeX (DUF496 family)